MAIVPDDKNWTWVLQRPCPDCGFDASAVELGKMGELIRGNVALWPAMLAHEHARLRPTGDQWSATEYGCHVRDVFRVYDARLRLMLESDAPLFQNWDQDATAVEQRYDLQHPEAVSEQLQAAGAAIAGRFDTVTGDQWDRTGSRSDGAEFTVGSLARYLLHDLVHHVDDVARGNRILADSELD